MSGAAHFLYMRYRADPWRRREKHTPTCTTVHGSKTVSNNNDDVFIRQSPMAVSSERADSLWREVARLPQSGLVDRQTLRGQQLSLSLIVHLTLVGGLEVIACHLDFRHNFRVLRNIKFTFYK